MRICWYVNGKQAAFETKRRFGWTANKDRGGRGRRSGRWDTNRALVPALMVRSEDIQTRENNKKKKLRRGNHGENCCSSFFGQPTRKQIGG